MIHALLRYKSFVFDKNPAEITFKGEKILNTEHIPFSGSFLKENGAKPKIIKSSGSFSGENRLNRSLEIQKLFDKGGEGMLFLSDLPPVNAVMSSLSVYEKSGSTDIFYDIEFYEVPAEKGDTGEKYITAKEGDSLWSISAEYDIDIEKLVELNPLCIDPWDVSEGGKIRIA